MTFSIGGCRVAVSLPFLAAAALLLTLDSGGAVQTGFLCAAFHESAHFAAMKLTGDAPRGIRLTPFGAEIARGPELRSYRKDIAVSLAGPLANLAAWALLWIFTGRSLWSDANLLLAVCNLLPVEPLDGGQALLAFLSMRRGPEKARKTVLVCSFCTLIPFAAAGFFVLLRSRWNFSWLAAACYFMWYLLAKDR